MMKTSREFYWFTVRYINMKTSWSEDDDDQHIDPARAAAAAADTATSDDAVADDEASQRPHHATSKLTRYLTHLIRLLCIFTELC